MATRRSDEEKLLDLNKKLEQLQNQKKAIQARVNKQNRKARTRRLIQIGVLAEKYFDCTDIEPEEFENLLKEIITVGGIRELLFLHKFNSVEEPDISEWEESHES